MKTSVVLIIYKRYQNLLAITDVLRKVKPAKIFIIADGPKNKTEKLLTDKTRKNLELLLDWPCMILKNYSKNNLGLKERFSSGISWVFEQTDRAIFLEDDCIPDPTFFRYCDELLEKYQNDNRVMTISGNNFQFGKNTVPSSYYFSRYPHVWGWATWKRVWDHYDSNITTWPEQSNTSWLRGVTGGLIISKFWKYIFNRLFEGKINTWDYQLTYASFKNNGLNIIPSVNLVTNVGYGADSTNIKTKNKTISVPTTPMQFPLIYPKDFAINDTADQAVENLVYLSSIGKVSLFIKSILGFL